MGATDPQRAAPGGAVGGRRCAGCGKVLAADNTARLCSSCHRDQRDQLRTPPAQLRNEFFETDEFEAAFQSENIGKVFRAYRNHPRHLQLFGTALTQELLGRWLGLTQAQVSKLEMGLRQEENLSTLRNYAKILHLPQDRLWFDLPGTSRLRLPTSSRVSASMPSHDGLLIASTGLDTVELLSRVRRSAVDPATVDALSITVEQLCCDYAHADARELMAVSKKWLGKVTELLGNQLTLIQHRDILHNAGMLALLVGCLEYDLGYTPSAEATRRMAMELGKEAGDPGIAGWAHEMLAWFHLTAGNHRAVIPAAQAGIALAPSHSVAVQLYGQQAKAYARMGMPEQVHEALESGRALLDTLPYPDRPDNHFVVDPDKWDFYAMDAYRIVGHDQLARRNAEEVIRRSLNPDGYIVSPMRRAEAELTLAVVAARQGDVDEATSLGIQALQGGRQSRPSLLMVAGEVQEELRTFGHGAGAEFEELLSDIKRSPQTAD
ncbi:MULTISPECIES: bacterial transcriptional activator domain-containing protein [unclassified Crossiella]|uniref:bacterial transcriptional activator domain-containing protein n=1 Tax=unclassified Crossiella TaxID=2620835 RepID=UPI001FFFE04F|nr:MULTISPECIES: bacterial transcriptional activator domain-containing protein [unclassified Crossiella]MCK2240191.1 bacterial transcriptional activator domain-containing protein [Crossiella sp. S99.2]MCK2253357.1 bacterial transcriptional activator domain-containing protein [Crossiella sp. S99.1]